jgi:hypothetical protein
MSGRREPGGESINQYGTGVARTNESIAYDVFNRCIVDIATGHYRGSEITTAKEIVEERPVLYIFDRNYASIECMDYLEQSGVNYLIRLHKGDYQREREGMTGADAEVSLACTADRLRALRKEAPQRAEELARRGALRMRRVTMKFDNGEAGALITNLGKECRAADIRRLYRKRWAIETK